VEALPGTLAGALPGIGPPRTIIIVLPATVHIDPVSGHIMFAGGSMYGVNEGSNLVRVGIGMFV
jgi:putative tricarboxylic transport membrane protein